MELNQFDYKLPLKLIAQTPTNPRDHSRLLVLERKNQTMTHDHFYNIIKYLKKGDVIVFNDSKVFSARLIGQKEITGGKVEILLNHETEVGTWECVGKNLSIGLRIKFKNSKLKSVVLDKIGDVYIIRFNISGIAFFNEIEKIGLTPLPPYIKRIGMSGSKNIEKSDRKNYQTIYAKEVGSVAAPTAGLHFTKDLIKKIKKKGLEIEYLTLHVGLGTFAPVKEEKIRKHKIHKEFYSINQKTLNNIAKAKFENRRIIAVGTTTVRTLETIFNNFQSNSKSQISKSEKLNDYKLTTNNCLTGWTDIFIYPGYKFKCVNGLITNFHLPKSTLLMLISAFAGKDLIDKAYQEAINSKYRFFSYGDAMLIT